MSLEDVLQPPELPAPAKNYIKWVIALASVLALVASVTASGAFYVGVELTKFRLKEEESAKQTVALTMEVAELRKALKTRDEDLYAQLWAAFRISSWDCYPIPIRGGKFEGCAIKSRATR